MDIKSFEDFIDREAAVNKFKQWLKYFATGIWVLIFFGLMGFAVLFWFGYQNLEKLRQERQQTIIQVRNSGVEQEIHKGKNI